MKKFKTMMAMMLALVSMCVAFSSCSSDDDDNNGAGSSATAEQVCVGQLASLYGVSQGPGYGVLPKQGLEGRRPVFSG